MCQDGCDVTHPVNMGVLWFQKSTFLGLYGRSTGDKTGNFIKSAQRSRKMGRKTVALICTLMKDKANVGIDVARQETH